MHPETICPLCNGLESITMTCPQCGNMLEDYGPVSYLVYSYSPYYLSLEEMKRDDGWIDQITDQCPHQFFCPNCNYMDIILMQEKGMT